MSEYNYNQQYQPPYPPPAPQNSSAGRGQAITSMVLGILSICGSYTCIVSLVLAIVGLVMSNKAAALGNTSAFCKAGRITSTIGLVLSIVAIVVVVLYVFIVFVIGIGASLSTNW